MDLELTAMFLISVAALGFIAGTLGGMLGVGGSVIMIPGLVMLLGQDKIPGVNQHIYQAAAMIANVAVSVPAALRHHQARATCPQAIKWLLPSTLFFVLVGVWLSNQFTSTEGAVWLGRCLAFLLAYVIVMNIRKLIKQWRTNSVTNRMSNGTTEPVTAPPETARASESSTVNEAPDHSEESISDGTGFGDAGESDDPDAFEAMDDEDDGACEPPQATNTDDSAATAPDESHEGLITPVRCITVGSVMGILAGLMGVGGGAIAVPLQQIMLKLPLRRCIANSSAVICISAAVGAVYKNASLSQHVVESTGDPYKWQNSVALAMLLAPTCFIGGRIGAALTHALPLRWVRGAFIALLCAAAYKMAAIPW